MSPFAPLSLAVTAIAFVSALVVMAWLGGGWRVAVVVLGWLGLAFGASVLGFFEDPTRLAAPDLPSFFLFGTVMTLPVVGIVLALRRHAGFAARVAFVPTHRLVALQTYRLGGAAFLVMWGDGALPSWFALSTGLLDMLIGLTALPLAAWLRRDPGSARPVVIGWAVLGLADFAHAIGYVFAATFGLIAPVPEPAMIGLHPLALISLFLMPIAIVAQGLVLLRLGRATAHAPT
jgi:hypothetical protein